MEYSNELVLALAHGSKEAEEQIKSLPTTVRMGLALEVEKVRREKQIVPMSNGFSLYEQPKSSYYDDEQLGLALADRNRRLKEAEAKREKDRQEFAEMIAKEQTARARARLARTDR
ncbi:hypothetical protein [Streptomyces californicus]|uniref:hypothetical protein n=1 Tax=Streptomyces californicus TaxID=67351 RepID=UPI00364B54C2